MATSHCLPQVSSVLLTGIFKTLIQEYLSGDRLLSISDSQHDLIQTLIRELFADPYGMGMPDRFRDIAQGERNFMVNQLWSIIMSIDTVRRQYFFIVLKIVSLSLVHEKRKAFGRFFFQDFLLDDNPDCLLNMVAILEIISDPETIELCKRFSGEHLTEKLMEKFYFVQRLFTGGICGIMYCTDFRRHLRERHYLHILICYLWAACGKKTEETSNATQMRISIEQLPKPIPHYLMVLNATMQHLEPKSRIPRKPVPVPVPVPAPAPAFRFETPIAVKAPTDTVNIMDFAKVKTKGKQRK